LKILPCYEFKEIINEKSTAVTAVYRQNG